MTRLSMAAAMDGREFHLEQNGCACIVGPRGGRTLRVATLRRNGATKRWKRQPERFQIPVKYGLYQYGHITDTDEAHLAHDCPAVVQYQEGREND